MSLIALIIALLLERTRHSQSRWVFHELCEHWYGWLPCRHSWSWLLFGFALPTLVLITVQWLIQGWLFGLLSLIWWIALPLLVLGCPLLQRAFRDYLRQGSVAPQLASQHFNERLTRLFPGCLNHPIDSQYQTGLFLCWINFRYYFAIVFWFALGGPALAVGYALLRSLEHWSIEHPEHGCNLRIICRLMHVLDWLPSRLCAFSYALTYSSTTGFKIWLASLSDFKHSNADWLAQIARECIRVPSKVKTNTEHAMAMMQLLKSSLLVALAILALFTIYGWLI